MVAATPLVSIITVNYNGAEHTLALLDSLQKISYPAIEVWVVDNGSTENADVITQKHPWVHLVKSTQNLGFAGGNNLALKQATGKYCLLINNDTEVPAGFLEPLVEKLETDAKCGCVSPKLVYSYAPDTMQYAGSFGFNVYTGRAFARGSKEKDEGQYNGTEKTEIAHGAAMMFPKRLLKEIGLMAELYFLYYEEIDYCERIKRAGYEIWYVGSSTVYHKESMSTGKKSPLKTYYLTRNRLLFVRRNFTGLAKLSSVLFFYFAAIPKNLVTLVVKKEWKLIVPLLKAAFWNLTHHNIHTNEILK